MPTITVLPDGFAITATPGETILDALRRHGYTMFFGCRRGGCGVCRVRLLQGTVHHGPYAPQALPEQAAQAGMALACRAMVDSEVVVAMSEDNRFRKLIRFRSIGTQPSVGG